MQKLTSLRVTIYLALLCSIVSLIACASSNKVQMEKSDFDGKENLIMKDIVMSSDPFNITNTRPKTILSLNWNDSMPKDSSLAKITIFGQYRNSNNTTININVSGEKFKFKPIDINKTSDVTTKSVMSGALGHVGANRDYVETENTLELYFYIPDDVVLKIARSKDNSPSMINLANNVRVESSIKWFYKDDFANFINKKRILKSKL